MPSFGPLVIFNYRNKNVKEKLGRTCERQMNTWLTKPQTNWWYNFANFTQNVSVRDLHHKSMEVLDVQLFFSSFAAEKFPQREVNFKALQRKIQSDKVDRPQLPTGSANHINIHDKKRTRPPLVHEMVTGWYVTVQYPEITFSGSLKMHVFYHQRTGHILHHHTVFITQSQEQLWNVTVHITLVIQQDLWL